LDNWQGQ